MTNIGVGLGEGGKERDTDHGAPHLAIANIVTGHPSARLASEVSTVEQCCGVAG